MLSMLDVPKTNERCKWMNDEYKKSRSDESKWRKHEEEEIKKEKRDAAWAWRVFT